MLLWDALHTPTYSEIHSKYTPIIHKVFYFWNIFFLCLGSTVPELLGLQCHETTSRITEHEVSQTSVSGGAMAEWTPNIWLQILPNYRI